MYTSGMSNTNTIAIIAVAATGAIAATVAVAVYVDVVSITNPFHGIAGALIASVMSAAWKATNQ